MEQIRKFLQGKGFALVLAACLLFSACGPNLSTGIIALNVTTRMRHFEIKFTSIIAISTTPFRFFFYYNQQKAFCKDDFCAILYKTV